MASTTARFLSHSTTLCAAACALFVVVGCGPSRPKVETFHKSGRVEAGAFPDVDAVVLLDRSELTFTYSVEKQRPYAELIRTIRVQVLREEGVERAKVQIPFDRRSRVLHIQARRISPQGDITEMPPDRAVDLRFFKEGTKAANFYGDVGGRYTKVSDVQVGDVFEVSWVRVYRDAKWIDPLRISRDIPVVRGEVVVNYPKSYDVDYRVTRKDRVDGRERPVKIPARVKGLEDPGQGVSGTRLAFVFENERAIYPEEGRPDLDALATQVHVQLRGYTLRNQRYDGFRSWDDVARWYTQLTKANAVADDAVQAQIKALGGTRGRKRDQIRRVQRYLQDEIDDVPAFFHLAALKTHAPGEVIQQGMGDAKDQAQLGIALLKGMGLGAFPVLVSRAGSSAQVPDLPTPAPFNHVILAIPSGGRYTFIDPSTPMLPTGRLPGALQGQRGVLLRDAETAELIDLSEDDPKQNRVTFDMKLALALSGIVTGRVQAKVNGVDAAKVRKTIALGGPSTDIALRTKAVLQPGDETKLVYKDAIVAKKNAAAPDRTLQVNVIVGPSDVAPEKDGRLALNLESITGRLLPSFWREARQYALVLDAPFEQKIDVELSLPDGWGLEALPKDREITSEGITIKERYSLSKGVLYYTREAVVNHRRVEADRYLTVRQPLARLWAAQSDPILVVAGGKRGQDYGADEF